VAIDPRLSPLAALQQIADSLEKIDNANERNRKFIELQRQILQANREWSGLDDEIRELKDQIRAFDTWEALSKRYRLIRIEPGVYLRELVPETANNEPTHFLCEDCFGQRQRGMIHFESVWYGTQVLQCGRCKAKHTINVGANGRQTVQIAQGTNDYDPFEKYR
jgi:hypothetical protein